MTKMLIALAAVLALTACEDNAERVERTSNPNYDVRMLFEHEGCKVYRFSVNGNSRYYTRCDSGSSSAMWTEQCGKSCTRRMEIATTERR